MSLVVQIVARSLIDRFLVDAVVHFADFGRPAPASMRAVAHNRLVNRVRAGRVPAVPHNMHQDHNGWMRGNGLDGV